MTGAGGENKRSNIRFNNNKKLDYYFKIIISQNAKLVELCNVEEVLISSNNIYSNKIICICEHCLKIFRQHHRL